jgi:hypothetical protein
MPRFLRRFASSLGFWLVPVMLALVLSLGGGVVGYASAAGAARRNTPPANTPIESLQEATNKNGTVGQVVRLGPIVAGSRMVVVRDRLGKTVRMIVTPKTIIKKNGKRIAPAALRPNDVVIGVGAREKTGLFQAAGLVVLGPNDPENVA